MNSVVGQVVVSAALEFLEFLVNLRIAVMLVYMRKVEQKAVMLVYLQEGGISGRFKDCGDKSETEQKFKKFHLMVQNLFNSKIQVFCIDNGGEYFNTILGKYL